MTMMVEVKSILKNALILGPEVDQLKMDSPLLGTIRELDSVGVMAVITALEEHYDIEVDDSEITGEIFQTLGSLVDFVEQKTQ